MTKGLRGRGGRGNGEVVGVGGRVTGEGLFLFPLDEEGEGEVYLKERGVGGKVGRICGSGSIICI